MCVIPVLHRSRVTPWSYLVRAGLDGEADAGDDALPAAAARLLAAASFRKHQRTQCIAPASRENPAAGARRRLGHRDSAGATRRTEHGRKGAIELANQ